MNTTVLIIIFVFNLTCIKLFCIEVSHIVRNTDQVCGTCFVIKQC